MAYNPEMVKRLHEDIDTNMGRIPVIDYLEIYVQQTQGQHGCDNLYEFLDEGFQFPKDSEFASLTMDDLEQYDQEREAALLEEDYENGYL